MRFERVTADAFGPFSGPTLDVAPGFTIVWGLNESGKSSWHAALYAGLCGMRRGRGAVKSEDREFTERHRPWNGDGWRVSAVILLDDGRRIELSHDLDGRVDCRAVDADTGRDVSGEIMAEGAPDGSRWLGFDRKTFPAIACVRQTELLAVLEQPESLQEHLQRAADTAGGDATAAAALNHIDEFRKLHVGQDRINSPRPLRRAIDRVRAAMGMLEQVRTEHAEFLQLVRRTDELDEAAATLRQTLRLRRAAKATHEAVRGQERLARARELTAHFPDGAPPPLARDDALAQQVSAALELWAQRATIAQLGGPSAAELQARIATLPAPPLGDRTADAEARASVDPALEERLRRTQHRVDALPSKRMQMTAIILGTVLSIAAAAVIAFARQLSGLGLLAVGIGVLLWAALRGSARLRAIDELRALEQAVGAQRRADEIERRERADLAAQAAQRSALVQQLANREAAERAAEEARQNHARAEAGLREAAATCGVTGEDETALVQGLRNWQERRAARLHDDEARLLQWTELDTLLERGTLAQLEDTVRRQTREARRLSEGIDPTAIATLSADEIELPELTRLERESEEAARAASEAEGNRTACERTLRSVAEAEEELAAAERELARVRRLEDTLESTRRFLEKAEERVHRDVARTLADTIRPWLPTVTAGHYDDVRVDPEALAVTVRDRGGEWRNAALLSHGTAEQIYLLLRVALAKHLAKPGETCPLILDDPTVQCDSSRTTAILNLLHEISKERQVIVFSQEDEVLAWAQSHLRGPQDRLWRLNHPTHLPTVGGQ